MEPPTNSKSLLNLPYEILEEIALNLDFKSLTRLCFTNTTMQSICQDDGFWGDKYRKDFDPQAVKTEGESWQEKYRTELDFPQNYPFSTSTSNYAIIDNTGTLSIFRDISYQDYQPINPFPKEKVVSVSTDGEGIGVVTTDGEAYLIDVDLNNNYQPYDPVKVKLPGKAKQIAYLLWVDPKVTKNVAILLEDGSIYFTGQISSNHGKFHIQNITAKRVYLGYNFLAYIDLNGRLYIWGSANFIKDNDTDLIDNSGQPIFTKLKFEKQIKDISFGRDHLVILTKDGQVYQIGSNLEGQLGFPIRKFGSLKVPTLLSLPPIARISSNSYGTVAITKDKRVIIWGNPHYILKSTTHLIIPTYFDFGKPIIDVSLADDEHNPYLLLLTDDKEVLYAGTPEHSPYGQGKVILPIRLGNGQIVRLSLNGS